MTVLVVSLVFAAATLSLWCYWPHHTPTPIPEPRSHCGTPTPNVYDWAEVGE